MAQTKANMRRDIGVLHMIRRLWRWIRELKDSETSKSDSLGFRHAIRRWALTFNISDYTDDFFFLRHHASWAASRPMDQAQQDL